MYAQLVMLKLGKGMRSTAEKIADQSSPTLKTLKGFKSITFFGDEEVGEYGSLASVGDDDNYGVKFIRYHW